MEITSLANPRVKSLVALRRRRTRDEAGITLVEGFEELAFALSAGVRPTALYWCPELAAPGTSGLPSQVADAGGEVVQVSEPVFGKIAYRESPDGWLAVVPAVPADLGRLSVTPADGDRLGTGSRPAPGAVPGKETGRGPVVGPLAPPLVLVCGGVEKPGNLGAILRTADAAGATAVIAADPVTDWGNPNVVRASKGTLFSVPVAAASSADVLGWIADQGLTLVATTPDTDMLLTDADLTQPVALAVGSEKHGLSPEWLAHADARVRIPMFGRADSLNVATSAAVAAYEAVRQRMAAGIMAR